MTVTVTVTVTLSSGEHDVQDCVTITVTVHSLCCDGMHLQYKNICNQVRGSYSPAMVTMIGSTALTCPSDLVQLSVGNMLSYAVFT